MTTELVPKVITPSEIFVPKGLDPILAGVRGKVKEFNAESLDMEILKERDKLRTFAADIARSKTFIDDKRKLFVKDKKSELKIIDTECKTFRDAMDEIKVETRKPLTDWEDAEKIRVEEERQAEIAKIEEEDRLKKEELEAREKAIADKEAEFKKIEDDRLAKEEADRIEKERVENEARIKKEAAEQAEIDADAKINAEREAKERAELEAKEALVREENVRLKAEEDAKQAAIWAENDRVQAEEKAKKDQEEAVQKAKDDAAAKTKRDAELEKIRLSGIKEEEERKASNKRHQASVNNKVLSAFLAFGLEETVAKGLVIHIAKGGIPKLRIEY